MAKTIQHPVALDDIDHNLFRAFRNHLEGNPLPSRRRSGASDATIRGYAQDVSIFLRWSKQTTGSEMSRSLLEDDPYQLNKKLIQDFIAWLRLPPRRYAVSTVLRYAASLRAFSQFLQATGIIKHDPTIGLRLPQKPQSDPRGLEDSQRARFEAVFQTVWPDKTTKRKRSAEVLENARQLLARNKAIAFLMLYAGPRVEEVERLELGDIEIHPRSGAMRIREGKGFKERDVPLPLPAREALQAWLNVRKAMKIDENNQALFVELRKKRDEDSPVGFRRLSRRSMQMMIAEAGIRAQLDKQKPPVRVTPHVLRHTYSFMLRKRGVSLEVRAMLAGHSMETAMKYGKPRGQEMERAVELLDDAAAA